MNDELKITRRQALGVMAAGSVIAWTGSLGFAGTSYGSPAPEWLCLLGASERGGRDYTPRVEGTIPLGLNGSLYRNGPGLFERGGVRKRHLLDGDGLVQRLSFSNGAVRYQNAFVQTPKFLDEEAAGRYLYSTWSTRRPGGPLRSLGGGRMMVQAGVTVYPVGDKVYALDEGNPIFELDPDTLATRGSRTLGENILGLKAHTKFDPVTGEWLLIGQGFGRRGTLYALVVDRHGQLRHQHKIDNTPLVYIHDFLLTEHYFVYVLHPCELEVFGFLLGLRSVSDSLRWRPEKGNQVVLLPRAGGTPQYFEAPGAFMWHALNAYERGNEVIADIVAYDNPDHFIGDKEPVLYALAQGRMGAAEEPGKIRRYVINTQTGRLKEEILNDGNHEFPFVDPRVATRPHHMGYYAYAGRGILQTGLKSLDMNTGAERSFDFGARVHVGEPVFVPRPEGAVDEGWLIAQCLDGASKTSFFAIFDAQSVEAGPLANVWLEHHVPISFHGWWRTES